MSDSLQHHGLYSPWNSPGQNTVVGSLSLLQQRSPWDLSNPGIKPRSPALQPQGKSKNSGVGSLSLLQIFQPRNRTKVSCIAGGFFTSWARGCIQTQSLEKLSIKWRWQICELMNSGRCKQFYRWVVEIQNTGNKFAQSGHINRCLI